VKAALLLVTAACFTGQAPPAAGGGKPELVKPPAVWPAPVASSVAPGCGACDTCADCGHKHFGGFGGGLFSRHSSCDGGCDSCAPKAHCHKVWTAPSCNTCDSCGHESFFSKLKGKFGGHGHHAACCDGGCSSGGCAPSVAPAEPVNPPKKMPPPPGKEGPPPAKVGIDANATPIAPINSAPTIEIVAPAVPAVPSITTQPRSPF
jgi:hypothetical protein